MNKSATVIQQQYKAKKAKDLGKKSAELELLKAELASLTFEDTEQRHVRVPCPAVAAALQPCCCNLLTTTSTSISTRRRKRSSSHPHLAAVSRRPKGPAASRASKVGTLRRPNVDRFPCVTAAIDLFPSGWNSSPSVQNMGRDSNAPGTKEKTKEKEKAKEKRPLPASSHPMSLAAMNNVRRARRESTDAPLLHCTALCPALIP